MLILGLSGLGLQAFAKAPSSSSGKPASTQDTLDWLAKPGVKAIIYTELEPEQFMTIESENGLLSFKSCECNQPPNCPDLLAPFFTFSPEELLSAGKKPISFLGSVEVLAGAFLIAAPSIPGLPNPGALLGDLPMAGNAINPEAVFAQTMKADAIGKNITKTIQDGVAKGAPPIAVMKAGGDYSQLVSSFRTFLIGLKSRTKDEKTKLTAEEKQYYEDVASGKVKSIESCEAQTKEELDEVLTELKSIQPAPGAEAPIKRSKEAQIPVSPQ